MLRGWTWQRWRPRRCKEYGDSRLRFDRMQAKQLMTSLARSGITTEEFIFSLSGVSKLTRALYGALRDRAIELPDQDETRAEFLVAMSTQVVPTGAI